MKNRDTYRETCLVIAIGLFLIYILKWQSNILLIAIAIVSISGLFVPAFSKIIHQLWMGLAKIMGWFMSKIILSIVFFIFLTPIALLQRIFTKNTSQTTNSETNWREKDHVFTIEDLKKIW